MVGGAIPGLVVLGSVRRQAQPSQGKQASKQLLSMASASAPASGILPCLSSCPDFLQR